MRKKVLVVTFLIATVCLSVAFAFSHTETLKSPAEIGMIIGNTMNEVINIDDGERIVGTIMGEEIEFSRIYRIAVLHEMAGSVDPLQDALNTVKIQVYERQFAIDNGILPTEEEIFAFTREMREMVEGCPIGRSFAEAVIYGAGMTWDEYWNYFKPRHESPAHLTSIMIADHFERIRQSVPSAEMIIQKIDIEINDAELLDKFENRNLEPLSVTGYRVPVEYLY